MCIRDSFNTLSTNLSFAGASVKKIMITSCHAAEGKSYLSMNLMRTLAQRGIKVALVDADLRRSLVNSDYGLKYEDGRSDGKGLSHFLAGMVGMDEVIYQTDIPNAIMVPVGRDVDVYKRQVLLGEPLLHRGEPGSWHQTEPERRCEQRRNRHGGPA